MVPTREIYWNIEHHTLLYAFFAIALAIFSYGMYRRARLWFTGQKEDTFSHLSRRLVFTAWTVISHRNILMEVRPGIIHALIFFSFTALFIGTCLVALQLHLGWPILYGDFYLYYSLLLDIFGALFITGILLATIRRYLFEQRFFKNRWDDAIILGLLFSILLTGFLIEGARIAATTPAWGGYSPVGYAFSRILVTIFSEPHSIQNGTQADTLSRMHRILWWLHMTLAMGFIAYIPYSKLLHILTSPLNILLHSTLPKGALKPLAIKEEDIETGALETHVFGVLSPKDFTWKQLLDVDACMRCGRCDSQCPATLAEKPLMPQKIILDIKSQMEEDEDMKERLVGGKISEAEIWACTTCLACVEHCPVYIEHLQKIIDLRRGPGLMEGKYPAEITRTIKNLQSQKNPYGLSNERREDWMQGIDVKRLSDSDNNRPKTLFWVGCAGAFDDRNQRVTRAFAKILKEMGLDFGVLGGEEICCGDPLRRFGNEADFQQLVRQNIKIFEKHNVKEIVTCCPHCFNTLKNEYPQFGGNFFDVLHHTEFISAKSSNQIKDLLNKKAGTNRSGKTVTYHDPCYLGRHNDIYDEPREILKPLPNIGLLKEMERSRDRSFCCGGGGGHMWMEQRVGGKNINEMRTDQALETGAETIVTACPYCLTMLSNGLKARDREDVKVLDIAEVLAGS
ncbi:MAG: heterodisulfide reductase-related iron-sulfur binding cluster [Candidatus Brocadiales bacterium]